MFDTAHDLAHAADVHTNDTLRLETPTAPGSTTTFSGSRARSARELTPDTLIIWRLTPALIGLYVLLALTGHGLLVTKTLILPLLGLYALCHRERAAFLRDWGPYVAGTLLFDACRGLIFTFTETGAILVHRDYVILLEQLVTGTSAMSVALQTAWRSTILDRVFVAWHGSHFLFFLVFGLAVWHTRREEFWRYRSACLGVMYCGLVIYALIPTAPPWLASRDGLVPQVTPITHQVYAASVPLELVKAFDSNPVAAMPSLHIAFPAVCAMLGLRISGPVIGLLLFTYVIVQAMGVVYLGEHYLVDIIAGALLAWFVVRQVWRHRGAHILSLRLAAAYTAIILAGTAAIYLVNVIIRHQLLPRPN